MTEQDYIRVANLTRLRGIDAMMDGVFASVKYGIPEEEWSRYRREIGELIRKLERQIDYKGSA